MYTSVVTKSSENVEENNMVNIDFLKRKYDFILIQIVQIHVELRIALWHRLEFCFCISVSCNSGKHLQAFRFQLRVTKRMMVRWLNGHQLNGHESEQTTGDSEGWGGKPGLLQHMGLQKVRHDLVTEQQQLQSKRSHQSHGDDEVVEQLCLQPNFLPSHQRLWTFNYQGIFSHVFTDVWENEHSEPK